MSGRDAELIQLRAGVGCAVLLERGGYKLDRRESTRRCQKWRRGAGEIVIVVHDGRGWWDPCSDRKGDVFSLAKHLEPGLTFGQVRRVLSDLLGIAPCFPTSPAAQREKAPGLPLPQRWSARPVLSRGSRTWRYLTGARAVEVPVLVAAARVDAVREGPCGSAWFAHRNLAGGIAGIEMRGPDYRGFSAGGAKTLFRLPGRPASGATPATRLVVCEAPIDAMSLAGIERLRADTLYTATAGGMGPGTIVALRALLQELAARPDAVLVAATDADTAGERYAARLAELALEAGIRSGRTQPPGGCKDWNEVVIAHRRATVARPHPVLQRATCGRA